MATTREQLIADWRRRLAEAEHIPDEQSSRPAWMTRLRLRLYRFLISLYGEGAWSAGETIADNELSSRTDVVVADQALPLAGKPAKGESSIRAALQSFAAGSEQKPTGPLISGFDRNVWVVVASTKWGFQPQLSSEALLAKGITSRIVGHADDITVEVLAVHQERATAIIASQLGRLWLPPAVSPPLSPIAQRQLSEAISLAGGYLLLGLMVAPLLGVIAVDLTQQFWPEGLDAPTPTLMVSVFCGTWIASSVMMCVAYLLIAWRYAAVAAKAQPRK